jgi:DNA-binding PadR family transcriptional regulator
METRSRTPYTILGCLTIEPMSGYDVKRFLERSVVHFWSESYGQIYPALDQLEDEGLVEGREEPGERGRPKRVYRITEEGREELRRWLRQPAEPVTPRYEHSLKLFFGHNVGPRASLGHIHRLREQATEALAAYREWEDRLEEQTTENPDSPFPYWLVVLRGGIRYAEMVREWCDESEEALRSLEETSV